MARELTSGAWSPDKVYRFYEEEMRHAALVGIERRLAAHRLGRKGRFDPIARRWDVDIEGAAGETLICRELGVYHHAAYRCGVIDAGDIYQVRTTEHEHGYLAVYDTDDDAHTYVLVTGRCGLYRIRGCVAGSDARREVWRRDGYFQVPQSALGAFPAVHVGAF